MTTIPHDDDDPIIITHDVIVEILSWVPAQSLVNIFKFVCKAWRTLINDPVFITMHSNRAVAINGRFSSSSSNNNSLIRKSDSKLFHLQPPFDVEGLPHDDVHHHHHHQVTSTTSLLANLDSDFRLPSGLDLDFKLVGSCNGILCIASTHEEIIILVNPSTKRYKVSPKKPIESPRDYRYDQHLTVISYGFGCSCNVSSNNSTIDDYKVVRIVFFPPSSGAGFLQYEIKVYSMSTNSWRRIQNVPYGAHLEGSGVYANGAFHWIGKYYMPFSVVDHDNTHWDFIVSFNIREEKFGQVPLPLSMAEYDHPSTQYVLKPRNDGIVLMNMRGCLSIIRFRNCNYYCQDVPLEVWVMKDYGVKESWTLEFLIGTTDDPPRTSFSGYREHSLCGFRKHGSGTTACFLRGDQILIKGGFKRLALYDMVKKKTDGNLKLFGDEEDTSVDQLVAHTETLVSLKPIIPSPATTTTSIDEQRKVKRDIFYYYYNL